MSASPSATARATTSSQECPASTVTRTPSPSLLDPYAGRTDQDDGAVEPRVADEDVAPAGQDEARIAGLPYGLDEFVPVVRDDQTARLATEAKRRVTRDVVLAQRLSLGWSTQWGRTGRGSR